LSVFGVFMSYDSFFETWLLPLETNLTRGRQRGARPHRR